MKNVISASRRTDIPAFYLDWFKEKIKQGLVDVHNPFYRQNRFTVDLRPEAVSWIVFWSRNYSCFLRDPYFFDAYRLFFHFTILPPTVMEKTSVQPKAALKQMEQLCRRFGPEHIIWRYDPIVHWQEASGAIHTNHRERLFRSLCRTIASFGVRRVYFSFAHPYAKISKRMKRFMPKRRLFSLSVEAQTAILNPMIETAYANGMQLHSCCNDTLAQLPGVERGGCINGALLNRLQEGERVSEAKTPSRQDCGCTRSIDIGDYVTQPCSFGCIYCYANPRLSEPASQQSASLPANRSPAENPLPAK